MLRIDELSKALQMWHHKKNEMKDQETLDKYINI